MYVPKINELQDRGLILDFMRRHPFASLISTMNGRPEATHLPFVIREEGDRILLAAHFARANPQWLSTEGEALVIFQGPHAYISPQHYAHAQNVPTWNYVAVHAYGTVELIQEEARGIALLEELMRESEPGFLAQWAALDPAYRQGLYKGIVPFEITVTELEAKHKISQNKTAEERARIIAALDRSEDASARGLAAYMQAHGETGQAAKQ